MRWRAALFSVLLGAGGAPAAASVPPPCPVLEADGTVSHFILGFPAAELADETDTYGHGVLGDAIEYRTLRLATRGPRMSWDEGDAPPPPRAAFGITLPPDRVFEDIDIRVVPSVAGSWNVKTLSMPLPRDIFAVVETDMALGGSLALYRIACNGISKITATPPIGTPFRWLAPAGIEDFDGDGWTDIAYVETPHLRGSLKIVSLIDGELQSVIAPMAGFSNHAIGQDFITSGVRICRTRTIPKVVEESGLRMVQTRQPELLVPSLDRTTLHAVRIENGALVVEDRPEPPTPEGIRAAQICPSEEPAQ